MKKMRLYLDTSVIGGCLDSEFSEDSNRVLSAIRIGKATLLISEVVVQELGPAPAEVREIYFQLPDECVETAMIDESVIALRNAYLDAGIVGPESRDDATHVAAATISRADAIVSWNFKHIVRLDKMKQYNQINFSLGYGILTIVSPKDVHFDE